MKDIDNLTQEEIKERLDILQAYVRQAEGDPDLTGQYFDELKHLQMVYDKMIMDSQGRGIQMMQDLMEKPPATQDNYVAGVPVASSEKPYPDEKKKCCEGEAEVKAPAPAINLTINVVSSKEDGMKKSFDEQVSELAKSGSDRFGADIRIPINIAAEMRKSGSGNYEKAEKESSVDAVDLGKMREQKKKMVAGETPDYSKGGKKKKKKKKGEDEETEKSFYRDSPLYRAETNTLEKGKMRDYALGISGNGRVEPAKKSESQKKLESWVDSLLERYGSCIKSLDEIVDEIVKKVGVKCLTSDLLDYSKFARTMAWAIDGIRWKKHAKDVIFKSVETTLEKSGTLVAGKKAPTMQASATAYERICSLNAKITACEIELERFVADPVKGPEYGEKLKKLYEQLAIAIMGSEGLGLKTEDMSRDVPDPRFAPGYGFQSVSKSQSHGTLEKGRRSGVRTGRVGNMKYAMTYWDAEGGLSHGGAQKIAEVKIPSLKSAINRRLHAKIPHLADASTGIYRTEHVIALGGDENAPIKKVPGSGSMKKKPKSNRGKHLGHYKKGGPKHVVRG